MAETVRRKCPGHHGCCQVSTYNPRSMYCEKRRNFIGVYIGKLSNYTRKMSLQSEQFFVHLGACVYLQDSELDS